MIQNNANMKHPYFSPETKMIVIHSVSPLAVSMPEIGIGPVSNEDFSGEYEPLFPEN